ncbi:MAG: sialate O-acetylesterase [Saprospiraceae bacterium]|jgi:sialate O-acetylesterase
MRILTPIFLIALFLQGCTTTKIETRIEKDWRYFSESVALDQYRSANENIAPPKAGEDRVVFMGNSITEAWPIINPEYFKSNGYIGRGISGQTTPQMLLRFKTDVISLQPKVVVILAGINDIAQNTGYTPHEIIAENIAAMSELAQYHGIEVILCSVLPAIGFPWSPGIKPANEVIALNKLISAYAVSNGLLYVDYYSALVDGNGGLKVPDYTAADDLVHPNKTGYAVMEGLVEEAIQVSLKKIESQSLSLSPLFSDHMVLQQKKDVSVWGNAVPKTTVKISASWGAKASTIVDKEGNWKVLIPTPKAGGPYNLELSDGIKSVNIIDVMIGEVWLASGQSNMQMPLSGWLPNDPIALSAKEIAKVRDPSIRMFTVSRNMNRTPQVKLNGSWKVNTPEDRNAFSATAYFFAQKLQEELNVPIGIIHSSWGGTVAEAWTSENSLRKLGDFNDVIDELDNAENEENIKAWFDQWRSIAIPVENSDWQSIDFGYRKVASTDYADGAWQTIELPGRYDAFGEMDVDGAYWFRKIVNITDVSSDYTFSLSAIDDMDETYINGVKIGGMAGNGHYATPRNYNIPEGVLKPGKNLIAIRAIDTGGPGLIKGDMKLESENGPEISLNGLWKYQPIAEIWGDEFYIYDIEKLSVQNRPKMVKLHPNVPTVLYNAMIAPLQDYNIQGAIWYQGESNVGRADQYERLFPMMIKDWRNQWNDDFPFYHVQIAPYNYNGADESQEDKSQRLRDAQRKSLALEKTGMAVTMDIGNYKNIHPANKKDVGLRLARWALHHDYQQSIVPSGPLFKSALSDGSSMIVEFEYVGSGLMAKDGDLKYFEVASADTVFHAAGAEIVGDKIIVSSNKVLNPLYVRYAWSDRGGASLYNREGLPASSFTSE